MEESDPSDGKRRTQAEGLNPFAEGLEKYPLTFSLQDGEVEHLCPSEDEEPWSLNIKRGIISSMQNSMKNVKVSQKIFEVNPLKSILHFINQLNHFLKIYILFFTVANEPNISISY